jgi:predicted dehydrogenase
VAKECDRQLMIGQCLRFEPSYLFLKDCIDDGRFGKLRSLFMDRLSGQPKWGFENWFADTEKSGGCIMDMHIHDVDMARFLLGEPQAVSTVAYDGISRWAFESTRLFYPDVVPVINGSWSETPGTPFRGDFYAVFEKATLSTRDGKLLVHPAGGEAYEPNPDGIDMYAAEIRYFAETILEDLPNGKNPPESAAESVKVIEALRRSAAQGGEKIAYP